MYLLDIPQMDVLMEDYSTVMSMIDYAAGEDGGLKKIRKEWLIIFSAYDRDPREIPEIPEAADWLLGSVDAGIPWFYILNEDMGAASTLALLTMVCCGRLQNGSYMIDRDALQSFVDRNFQNLEMLITKYGLSVDDVGMAGREAVDHILRVLFG